MNTPYMVVYEHPYLFLYEHSYPFVYEHPYLFVYEHPYLFIVSDVAPIRYSVDPLDPVGPQCLRCLVKVLLGDLL